MKKTAVIYWSGTGNTKAMAEAVLEGMKEAGADAALLEPGDVNGSTLSGVDAVTAWALYWPRAAPGGAGCLFCARPPPFWMAPTFRCGPVYLAS